MSKMKFHLVLIFAAINIISKAATSSKASPKPDTASQLGLILIKKMANEEGSSMYPSIGKLISQGANIYQLDEQGRFPVSLLTNFDPIIGSDIYDLIFNAAIQKLKNNNKRYSEYSLIAAINSGKYDYAKRLVDLGANINHMSMTQITPLFAAIIKQNKDMVQYLLNNGAYVTIKIGRNNWSHLEAAKQLYDTDRYFENLLSDKDNATQTTSTRSEIINLLNDGQVRQNLKIKIAQATNLPDQILENIIQYIPLKTESPKSDLDSKEPKTSGASRKASFSVEEPTTETSTKKQPGCVVS